MRTRTLVSILALALLLLGACAPVDAAQPTLRPQGTATTRADPAGTAGTQILTKETPVGTVTPAHHLEGSGATSPLAGNPFAVLLGPVITPVGSSVRPCPGEAPLLCLYRGRDLLGAVELATSLLAHDVNLQEMLGGAGIALGSVDYTDLENAPLVRTTLATRAAGYLDQLAQERGVAYGDKAYVLTPAAPEKIRVGRLPGIAYGLTSYDRDGRVLERRLTYAALDNTSLYLFSVFYAHEVPEGFASDEDLVRFEPYLRQILARLRLPPSEDWRSPGAELLQGPLLVVQRPDDSIQYVTLDGLSAVLVAEAPSSLLPAGYGGVPFGSGAPMMDGPIVYVRQLWGGLYALDRIMGEWYPLDFVPPPSPVAVRPLTEGLWTGGEPLSLAWGELSAAETTTACLHLSAPDGSHAVRALEETYGASDSPAQFVPWRWREDGQLYFSKQPVEEMGGFFPFVGGANLWLFDPQTGGSVELVSPEVTGRKLCLDAISPDDRRVAHHCDEGRVTILNPETDQATPMLLPAQITSDMQLGSVRFGPDGSRIAFAAMTGGYEQIEETRGYIVVSDNLSLSHSLHVIVASQPGEWFSVVGWLSEDRLLLQSHRAGPDGWPAVWTVRADGSGLVKLAEGTLLAGLGG